MIGAVTGVLLTLRSGLLAVPAVTGRSGIEATAILENAGLVAVDGGQRFSVTVPKGSVISQEPTAGSLVKRGDAVTVVVSAGSESQTMPDVIGQTLDQAKSQLEQLGFRVAVEPSRHRRRGHRHGIVSGRRVRGSQRCSVRLTVAGRPSRLRSYCRIRWRALRYSSTRRRYRVAPTSP